MSVATAQPQWLRTGYKFFPYAAQESGQWWVLRFNYGFPEHDMYTLFVDGRPTVDITGSADHSSALVRGIATLRPFDPGLPNRRFRPTRPRPWCGPSHATSTTAVSTMTHASSVPGIATVWPHIVDGGVRGRDVT